MRRVLEVAAPPKKAGVASAGDERRERRVTAKRRDHEPDRAEDDRRGPGEAEQDADIGRNALAAAKAQPDRKQVAEKSADRGGDRKIMAKQITR